jgi:hypothetical protein
LTVMIFSVMSLRFIFAPVLKVNARQVWRA